LEQVLLVASIESPFKVDLVGYGDIQVEQTEHHNGQVQQYLLNLEPLVHALSDWEDAEVENGPHHGSLAFVEGLEQLVLHDAVGTAPIHVAG
jgi:hypothetical protein